MLHIRNTKQHPSKRFKVRELLQFQQLLKFEDQRHGVRCVGETLLARLQTGGHDADESEGEQPSRQQGTSRGCQSPHCVACNSIESSQPEELQALYGEPHKTKKADQEEAPTPRRSHLVVARLMCISRCRLRDNGFFVAGIGASVSRNLCIQVHPGRLFCKPRLACMLSPPRKRLHDRCSDTCLWGNRRKRHAKHKVWRRALGPLRTVLDGIVNKQGRAAGCQDAYVAATIPRGTRGALAHRRCQELVPQLPAASAELLC